MFNSETRVPSFAQTFSVWLRGHCELRSVKGACLARRTTAREAPAALA